MGVALPVPVLTQLQEKQGNEIFRCGSSCVNGYRDTMEDAHLVYLEKNWGFFGVFDGHVNDQCSSYLTGAWTDVLNKEKANNGIPMSDERMKEVALQIDADWLETEKSGGSTATFFIASVDGEKCHLQVGNIGDSRVLACIDGQCQPLTEDHKPNNDQEKKRIEASGGYVENNRVNGSLALSRAFGDNDYKQSIDRSPTEQQVIALPDVTHAVVTLGSTDFCALCCDGVFEGEFSNEEVIDFIKEKLQTSNDLPDIAGKVCEEAIARGSHDNISCLIVQFSNGLDYSRESESKIVAGPFNRPRHSGFRKAYASMAQKGNSTIGKVLEMRYDILMAKKNENSLESKEEEELEDFKPGPEDLKDEARTAYFTELFENFEKSEATGTEAGMARVMENEENLNMLLNIIQGMSSRGADPGANNFGN